MSTRQELIDEVWDRISETERAKWETHAKWLYDHGYYFSGEWYELAKVAAYNEDVKNEMKKKDVE